MRARIGLSKLQSMFLQGKEVFFMPFGHFLLELMNK